MFPGHFQRKANFQKSNLCILKHKKTSSDRLLCQKTKLFPPCYHFYYRVFPVSLFCLPQYALHLHSVLPQFNRFPYNVGIPVRVNRILALLFFIFVSGFFHPDCSQVITSEPTLFPHTSRKLSESISLRKFCPVLCIYFFNLSLL